MPSMGVDSRQRESGKVRERMGAVMESPSIYLDMTAEENLKEQCRVLGKPAASNISALLKLVGLEGTGKKKAKDFSLGMRQRLGIGGALVGEPDFLILDEPVNGLDPQGIIEMRELIHLLNRERGITILISSHILDELSRLATHYGFIEGGRMLREVEADFVGENLERYYMDLIGETMGKLWKAGIGRLGKSKALICGMLLMAVYGTYATVELYTSMTRGNYITFLDEIFMNYGVFHIILSAAFCGLFLGTEYSDGTLRQKLIVGHTRRDIYLSSLALCTVGNLLICAGYMVPALAIGVPLLGFYATISQILLYVACGFVTSLSVAAIYTLVSMTSQSKARSAVICLLIAVALLVAGSHMNGSLGAPAELFAYEEMGNDQLIGKLIPNPAYLSGMKRTVYEFFYDLSPMGQAMQLSGFMAERLWRLPLFSGIITLVSTALGLFLFRKKDLK